MSERCGMLPAYNMAALHPLQQLPALGCPCMLQCSCWHFLAPKCLWQAQCGRASVTCNSRGLMQSYAGSLLNLYKPSSRAGLYCSNDHPRTCHSDLSDDLEDQILGQQVVGHLAIHHKAQGGRHLHLHPAET